MGGWRLSPSSPRLHWLLARRTPSYFRCCRLTGASGLHIAVLRANVFGLGAAKLRRCCRHLGLLMQANAGLESPPADETAALWRLSLSSALIFRGAAPSASPARPRTRARPTHAPHMARKAYRAARFQRGNDAVATQACRARARVWDGVRRLAQIVGGSPPSPANASENTPVGISRIVGMISELAQLRGSTLAPWQVKCGLVATVSRSHQPPLDNAIDDIVARLRPLRAVRSNRNARELVRRVAQRMSSNVLIPTYDNSCAGPRSTRSRAPGPLRASENQ